MKRKTTRAEAGFRPVKYAFSRSLIAFFMLLLLSGIGVVYASVEGDTGADHLPDLEAVNIWVFPPNPTFESEISLHGFIWNNSDVMVYGPIVVRIGIEGMEPVERVIPVLHPWEAVPVEAVFQPLEIGEYTAFIVVDPDGEIPEWDEGNNHMDTRFRVGPPLLLPDLSVIELRVHPREPTSDDEVTLEGMIWNDSEVAVDGPIVVHMGIDGDVIGEPLIINGLYPREAHQVSVVSPPLDEGEHIAFVRVDPDDQIRESREGNNHRLAAFDVVPPPPASVDLTPTGGTVLPPDGVLSFEALLRNHTDETLSFPFRISITQPGDGQPWIPMAEYDIELGPAEEWREDIQLALPQDPPLLPGPYLLVGEADDFDRDAFDFVVRTGGLKAQ